MWEPHKKTFVYSDCMSGAVQWLAQRPHRNRHLWQIRGSPVAAGEFARGLRNSVALAWSPFDGTLWDADISRQAEQGMKLPPDELNQIVAGGDYDWPYCYGRQRIDPSLSALGTFLLYCFYSIGFAF